MRARGYLRRAAYRDELDENQPLVVTPLHNAPPLLFWPGDTCYIGGLQPYRVVSAEWSDAKGDWLIHGRFGPCKFYLWQRDVRREP